MLDRKKQEKRRKKKEESAFPDREVIAKAECRFA
jgi:hypothetical protein